MSSPRFVSPGALAGNAIAQFLMDRDLAEQQRVEDEFKRARQLEDSQRQAEALKLQQQQEARIAAAQTAAQADLERQRGFTRASTIAEYALPDDPTDEATAAFLTEHGFGGQVRRGQPTQGAYLGDDEAGVPQYEVTPGILQLRGGSRYLNARAAEDARQATAEATRRAAEERAAADRESRELIARVMAESRRDAANAPGRQSDYERFLNRWATTQGITPSTITAEQELQAREAFYRASRTPSVLDEFFTDEGTGGGAAPGVVVPPGRAGGGAGPVGGAGGRTATAADIRAVAQQSGVSEAEVRRRFEAAGVAIR